MKSLISTVITTFNSQEFIEDCLKSARFSDEIIVVDNGSTDATTKIAKEFKAKVFRHKNNPNKLNESKNYGFKKATGSWVLNLDPDERIDPQLKSEIKTVLKQQPQTNGFLIPRKNIIFGKWIQHGLWYPDHQLRLFRNGKGKFPNLHNHELLEIEGQPQYLKNHITHHNYQTVSQYIQKIDHMYSDNEAEIFLKNNRQLHWHDAIRFPFQDFLTNYFARDGYKDGLHGLVLSFLQAFYMFIVFCKIWERQDFKQQNIKLDETKREFNRISKQLRYWFIHSQSQTAPLVKKIILKILAIF